MLTERQKNVLKAIVEEYVRTVQPVGSQTLIADKRFGLDVSPATIRNEMAALEKAGLILKPHTSSGRIPSEAGYRLYVQEILKKDKKKERFPLIDEIFARDAHSQESAIKDSVALVSQLTNYAALVLDDVAGEARIKRLEFIPISAHHAVLLMVTDRGYVESNKIFVPEDVSKDDLAKAVSILDELLHDTPINAIDQVLKDKAQTGTIKAYMTYHDELIALLVRTFTQMAKDKYFMSGQSQMMNLPEFQDIDKVRELFASIEREDILKIVPTGSEDLAVRIGSENRVRVMQDCTVISVPYTLANGDHGAIAVIGPTRMEYEKVIPLLEYIAGNLKKVM